MSIGAGLIKGEDFLTRVGERNDEVRLRGAPPVCEPSCAGNCNFAPMLQSPGALALVEKVNSSSAVPPERHRRLCRGNGDVPLLKKRFGYRGATGKFFHRVAPRFRSYLRQLFSSHCGL